MSRFRLIGFGGLMVASAIIGGTIISAVSAASPAPTAPAAAPGVAVPAATGEYCATFRAAFAADLGVSEDAVTQAARKAAASTIDKAVADGKLQQVVADRLKARLATAPLDACQRLSNRLERAGKAGLGVVRDALAAAADTLGMQPADLRQQLHAGTSLKTIASNATVDYAKLTSAVTAAVKGDLDKAVAAGTIEQARADKVLQRLATFLADGRLRRAP
jgi:ribosomal protein S20